MIANVRILLIGATGMLGRPVARRLAQDGFTVRATVRDIDRARSILPKTIEFMRGDLRDAASLEAAMTGVSAVYLNLNTPFNEREPYDPDRDGTLAVIAAAKKVGVNRILRLSAMGVPGGRADFWAIERKAQTDQALIDSGLTFTIFRPTWLMESLPLFMVGPVFFNLVMSKRMASGKLHWLSGDDLALQIAAAIRSEASQRKVYILQGPEGLTFREAGRRFVSACRSILHRRALPVPLPLANVRLGGLLSSKARYMSQLLDMTFKYTTRFNAQPAWDELGKPTTTIEEYVQSIKVTGDFPRK